MRCGPSDFLLAERLLTAEYASEAELYSAFYEAVRALVPADAFYLCYYEAEADRLHYVYNVEGERFDKPESLPLGDGPTSRVVKSGTPLIIGEEGDRAGIAFVPFANKRTVSGSAVHWPIWLRPQTAGRPDAVVSVQCYRRGVYGPDETAAVDWFARRIRSILLERRRDAIEAERRERERLAASRDRAVADVARFVNLLDQLAELRDDPKALVAEIRRRQIELIGWAPTAGLAHDETAAALESLTPRELEVLAFVAQGMSNEEVAEALMCSRHTVKRHLDNVYRQTPLRNRAEVAGASSTIHRLYMARKGQ